MHLGFRTMNSAQFSSKSHSSSTMSLELAFPGEMFIMQQSDNVNIDTNRIDSKNQLQNNLKQTTEKLESSGTANLGDQIHKYEKLVVKNKSKPTGKLPEPKNAGKFRSVHSQFQINVLNFEYQKNKKYITISERKEIARKLNLSEKQVKNWFQNKRTKEKRDEKKRLASKKELPPITTFSSISDKDIHENFYSLSWRDEKSLANEQSGSLQQPITSQDAKTQTDNFFLEYCPEKTVASNNFHLNPLSSLPHSSSGDTSLLSLQMAHEPNNNINTSWNQNDFLLNMASPSPNTVLSNSSNANSFLSLTSSNNNVSSPLPSLHPDNVSSNTNSFLSLRSPNNSVPSSPWVMQQSLATPDVQYFNQWIYPFYSYWPQNQQFNIKLENPDDFHANSHFQNNEQLLNYPQGFDYNQQNFDELEQFPLDFIDSYNLGNHFLNF